MSPFEFVNKMDSGWIKLHRKIKEKGYYKKSQYIHLWIHLLLSANHEPKEFMWNNNTIVVKNGELITGRKALSDETGIPETTIERILGFLEKECQIGQQKTTKYRLITILNWKEYQQTDNRRTTDGQQTDTNKNVINIRSNTSKKVKDTFLQGKQWNELIDLFGLVNPMYEEFYKNKTERKALDDLAKKISFEKLKLTIEHLPEIVSSPFAPRITKPSELKRDLGKLIAFYNQEKGKVNKINKNTPNYVV